MKLVPSDPKLPSVSPGEWTAIFDLPLDNSGEIKLLSIGYPRDLQENECRPTFQSLTAPTLATSSSSSLRQLSDGSLLECLGTINCTKDDTPAPMGRFHFQVPLVRQRPRYQFSPLVIPPSKAPSFYWCCLLRQRQIVNGLAN